MRAIRVPSAEIAGFSRSTIRAMSPIERTAAKTRLTMRNRFGPGAANPAAGGSEEGVERQGHMLDDFHPLVREWFDSTFGTMTEPQARGWPAIRAGGDVLISAPTGSGKTLTAFTLALDDLVRRALSGALPDRTLVVYVSPLKALTNDVRENLEKPLSGILALAAERLWPIEPIRTAVRTGDTTPAQRAQMLRRPPHVLVTTPESLFILLTAEKSRRLFSGVTTVIVDEIHAMAADKRGSHLMLTLARLDDLIEREN